MIENMGITASNLDFKSGLIISNRTYIIQIGESLTQHWNSLRHHFIKLNTIAIFKMKSLLAHKKLKKLK